MVHKLLNSLFKKIHVVNEEGTLQTKKIELVSPNITDYQTIELSDYDLTFNVFQSSNNQLTYNEIPGIYNNKHNNHKFILRNDNDGLILHCSYNINNNKKYEYIFEYLPTIKFYSIYKNGILQNSYSPFFTIATDKTLNFIITDHEIHLKEDKGYIKEFNGFKYDTDDNTNNTSSYIYYKDYEYYTVKNIHNTIKRKNDGRITIGIE